ncbi:uncharacterized protein (DUF305 family) [Actinomycetospora succinea]|uniref:Uncharacterized protein (DUF305 family) n=1 Tax=Actinomycetospora succinea TaxID=663603 RepID=A0A4R6UUX4_9PSEU|nr:DUF305 domain-containing protein [Actinomycetospora succinea]TDQ51011.1 uncharacterized protein (DUF305 family) [Actinomycetospora succinea]
MLRALAAVLIPLAALAGCADAPATPPASPDAAFVSAMVPHHEQALELTAMVGGRDASPGLQAIALRIDRAQVEEIGQMQGLALARGLPAGEHAMHGAMPGMADPATLDRLRALRGPEFERLWLDTMIRHHEGAVTMARDYTGSDDTLRRFAQVTVASQSSEIATMEQLRTSIAGS